MCSFFFFKQKTAYEIKECDWSSDVCSSDLLPWAVMYFFLIGISYAGFFLTLPAFVFGRGKLEGIARMGLVVALTCGIAAPIALVSDLHHPERFYNFYLHFTPGSWMSWGTFFISAYLVGLLIYAWLVYRPGLAAQAQTQSGKAAVVFKALGGQASPQGVKLVGLFTAIAAILVVVYSGSEMVVVKARVLWHGPFMPLLFLTTALAGAGGLALVLSNIYSNAGDNKDIQAELSRYMLVTSGLTVLLAIVWRLSGMTGMLVSGEAVVRLATEYNPVSFWLLWALLGTIVPFGADKEPSGYGGRPGCVRCLDFSLEHVYRRATYSKDRHRFLCL